MPPSSTVWTVVAAGVAGIASAVAALVDHHLGRAPYMDELFHVRQTQRYCVGHFWLWDPMITTFPGLYAIFHVLFALAATALSLLCGFADSVNGDAPPLCSVPMMRGMNVLFGFLNFFLFQRLLLLVYPPPSDKQADWGGSVRHAMMALLLHLFPVQFFFYFLYYTDTVSTFFVFLCYYYALKDNMTVSGLVAFVAVACRQTNIVWVCFIALSTQIRQYEKEFSSQGTIIGMVNCTITNLRKALARAWVFVILAISFLVFALYNEGIVIGDRSQHSPRLHFPQLFYFLTFLAAWLWPRIGLQCVNAMQAGRWTLIKRTLIEFVAGLAITLPVLLYLIHNYTYAHPYLLADNRHYPFYLWKNFFKRNDNFKYAYAPVYWAAGFASWKLLGTSTSVSPLWRITYFVCTAAVLVPAPLIEFRYFIVPFLFVLLHTMPARFLGEGGDPKGTTAVTSRLATKASVICLGLELISFAFVNLATMYIFLLRPFRWPSGEVVRIMW